jgi:hypothetical protein
VIEWDQTVFILEAKHLGVQTVWQWREQVRSAMSDPSLGWRDKDLTLIAVGGRRPDLDSARAVASSDLGCSVFRLRWRRLRAAVAELAHRSEGPKQRLLDDVVRGLDYWGYAPAPGLGSLGRGDTNSSFLSSRRILQFGSNDE